MQNKIVLDPSYRGPIIIEEYLRKMKSQSSLGRMISTYNKRFFTLDFKRMIFYYLPEKGSQLSNAQDIPLDSITRIYLDKQLQLLDDGQIWKHGFVILCGKRSYKLISHSQNNMENLLYAFAHLINTETQKPLFDWAEYKANIQAPIHDQVPQIFSPAVPGVERKDSSEPTALNQAGPVPKKKSSHDRRSDDETEKPNTIIRDNQQTSEHKGRQEIPEGPRTEEPALEVKREKSKPNNENVKQGAETKKKMSGERREEDQTVQQNNAPPKKLNIREVDSVDVCESQIIMANESVHANANAHSSEEEQPASNYASTVEEKGVEPLKNKMEVLNIDPSESTPTHSGPLSGKGKLNLNRRLMNQDSPKGNGWGQSPKSEFSGQLKAKTYKSSEDRFEVNRETSDANSFKAQQQISQDQDDGWGQVRKENVYKVEKKVQEVDEWDVESPPKKKNVVSKVQDDDDWDKDVNYSPPQKKSVPSHVGKMQTNTVKKANDDDDWDKDMSDDDNSKPQNNRFEIRTDAKYTSQTSGYSSSAGTFGRPTKTIEVPVAKGNVHNDWDDDL